MAQQPVEIIPMKFEKAQFDPLLNPDPSTIENDNETELNDSKDDVKTEISKIDVDHGWSDEDENSNANSKSKSNGKKGEKKEKRNNLNSKSEKEKEKATDKEKEDSVEIRKEYKIDQKKSKRKKRDFRSELTSDSHDIDDLLIFTPSDGRNGANKNDDNDDDDDQTNLRKKKQHSNLLLC